MKKVYSVPKIQAFNLCRCNVLAGSKNTTRYEYCCPYIPETECELYDEFVCRKIGINKGSLKTTKQGRLFISADVHCPYKKDCEDYQLFCKISNEKQR